MGTCTSRALEFELPIERTEKDLEPIFSYLRQNSDAQRDLVPILALCAAEAPKDPLLNIRRSFDQAESPHQLPFSCSAKAFWSRVRASAHSPVSLRRSRKGSLGQQWIDVVTKTKFAGLFDRNRMYKATVADDVTRKMSAPSLGAPNFQMASTGRASESTVSHDDWRYFVLQAERYIAEKSFIAASKDSTAISASRGDPDTLMHLYPYLPKVIKHLIAQGVICLGDFERIQSVEEDFSPLLTSFDAVVVFADASGFTKMTEDLAKQMDGAERIGSCLNGFFRPIIEIADMYGGDILKFSGDALTMIWPASDVLQPDSDNAKTPAQARSNMRKAILTALECCAALHRRCEEEKSPKDGKGEYESEMSLHIGIGCGHMSVLQVGGLLNRWEYLITGDPLNQISVAEPLASMRETVISAEVASFVRDENDSDLDVWNLMEMDYGCYKVQSKRQSSGSHYVPPIMFDCSRISRTAENPDPEQWGDLDMRLMGRFLPYACWRSLEKRKPFPARQGVSTERSHSSSQALARSGTLAVPTDRKISQQMHPHSLEHCGSMQSSRSTVVSVKEETYLEEMRLVSVVFINVEGLCGPETKGTGFAVVQTIVGMVQRAVYSQEGSLNKCLLDDKGFLMLCCFGLPPLNHVKDDSLRAVLFALRVIEMLQEEEGLVARAGVTTGIVWCGLVGSAIRREYTVLGDVVNLSARLMSSAKKNRVVVCDNTYQACRKVLEFKEPRTIKVKGKEHPLTVRTPTGSLYTGDSLQSSKYLTMFEWSDWGLQQQVRSVLERAVAGDGLVTISGQSGCGKGASVDLVEEWAASNNYLVLHGHNLAAGQTFTVPMQPWREICSKMVDLCGKDPKWKTRVEHKQRQWLSCPKLGRRQTSSFLYQLLCCMLEQKQNNKDYTSLIPWLPLAAMVIPNLDFNPDIVQSMKDADLDYSQSSRFGELVASLLQAFAAQPPAPYAGTIVICHIHKGTSFHDVPSPHARGVAEHVADLCRGWNKKECAPLLFVFVAREGGEHKHFVEASKLANTNVEMRNLTRSNSMLFTSRYFAAWLCNETKKDFASQSREDRMKQLREVSEDIQNSLPQYFFQYIFDMTDGNMSGVEILNQHVIDKEILIVENNRLVISSKYASREALHSSEVPMELLGIFVVTFEKMSSDEQMLLKNAVMFDDSFDVDDLAAFLPHLSLEEVQEQCECLVWNNVFSTVKPDNGVVSDGFGPSYRLRSILLKKVARNLVLQTRQMKSKRDISLLHEKKMSSVRHTDGMKKQLTQISATNDTSDLAQRESSIGGSRRTSRYGSISSGLSGLTPSRRSSSASRADANRNLRFHLAT